jgi:hypothetical protein
MLGHHNQIEDRVHMDVVVCHGTVDIQLLASKDEVLNFRGKTILTLDHSHDIIDGI